MFIVGVGSPFTGAFMDAKGPRKVILVAVVLSALGITVTAAAQNLWQLTVGYGLLAGGAGTGLSMTAWSLLVGGWFRQERRGRALGSIVAGMRLSTLAFGPLAAVLIVQLGWRSTYLVFATLILLVALPLVWVFLREPASAGETSSPAASRGVSFLNNEVRQALKTRVYWTLLMTWLFCGFAIGILHAHLPALALEHGFSPQEGALALGLLGATGAIGAVTGGWASDKFGRYKLLGGGFLLRSVGLFLLAFAISDATSYYVIIIIYGLPSVVTSTIIQLLIYETFGKEIAGRMMGLTFLLHQVASTISPYFAGWIFETTGSYTSALAIGAWGLLVSAFLSWRLRGITQKHITDTADPEDTAL
jgi:MFS family permease